MRVSVMRANTIVQDYIPRSHQIERQESGRECQRIRLVERSYFDMVSIGGFRSMATSFVARSLLIALIRMAAA